MFIINYINVLIKTEREFKEKFLPIIKLAVEFDMPGPTQRPQVYCCWKVIFLRKK